MHHALCTLLYSALIPMRKNNISTTSIIAVIDTDTYYDIFNYYNTIHQINLFTFIRNNIIYSSPVIRHIVTTRKVCFMDHNILYFLVLILTNGIDINKFFSFYDIKEINEMISTNIYGCAFYHNNQDRFINATMFFYCVALGNNALLKYIITHAEIHNVIILCTSTYTVETAAPGLILKHKNKLDQIHEQDAAVKFRLSLRYAWITGCII